MTRIVVADDDRVSSHLLCAIVRKQGLAPDPVFDVAALVAALDRTPVPLAILLDMHMPGGSGADSIRHIKGRRALDGVRLIVVSGSSGDAEEREAVTLGVTAFLHKPVDPPALFAALGVA